MLQQGQVLKLRGGDGRDVWGLRYRLVGRGSRRVQRGGFASERDASEALERALERVRRKRGCGSALTLGELVDEYLAQHDGEPETVEKLRWLLRKPVKAFRARRLPEPGEWIALEQRDIDCEARVVYVRRAYRNGRLKCTKIEASVRGVPL